MSETLTPEQAMQLIREHINAAGRKKLAEQHGISVSMVHKVYAGVRNAPASLLDELGIERAVTYTKKD